MPILHTCDTHAHSLSHTHTHTIMAECFDPRCGYIVQLIFCGYGVPKESVQGKATLMHAHNYILAHASKHNSYTHTHTHTRAHTHAHSRLQAHAHTHILATLTIDMHVACSMHTLPADKSRPTINPVDVRNMLVGIDQGMTIYRTHTS